MSDLAIDIERVSKQYGRIHALSDVGLFVEPGEVFGLLGPNGAGKSTLIKILMTVVRPSRCKGTVLGEPVGHKPTLAKIGYLPENHQFPGYLTGKQVIDFYGRMTGVSKTDRDRRTGELLELVGMEEWGDTRIRGYSKGMRQRIGIAQALVNDPDLVLLDEPTDGVDPAGRRDIRKILAEIRSRGKTVFLNSHLLSELEMVCGRVAILVKGEVAQQGTIDQLCEGKEYYEIEATTPVETIVGAAYPDQKVDEAGHVIASDRTVRINSTDPDAAQPVIDLLRREGVNIRVVRPMRPTLEDLFMAAVADPETGRTLSVGATRGED